MPPRHHICSCLSWPALQVVICLMASWGTQSGLASCSTNASYILCPTALEAAQFLVSTNSPLEISNAVWAPSSCTGPATWYNGGHPANIGTASTRILIKDFSCHGLAGYMPQGALVLSNGDATSAAAVNNTGKSDHGFSYTGQDADMQGISKAAWGNQALRDTLNLTFDVTSWGTGKVYFQYVFGSDEYPEYAPSTKQPTTSTNDIFAFFMWPLPNGAPENMALLPNSSTSVSIGSINPIDNTALYHSNTIGGMSNGYPGPYANAMDGFTVLMNTSTHSLIAGTTYRMKLAIADMYDSYLDSNVWIKQGSLQFTSPPIANCSGAWTNWTSCSASCSGGNTTSTYIWKWPASGGGITCTFANNTVNTTSCNTQPCPVNCVGSWTAWTNCSKACGGGTSNSTFVVTTPAAYGGTNCSFTNNMVNSTSCNTQPCPVSCVGSWTVPTSCSKTCGNGTQNSTYIITTVAANGGANCSFANNTVNTASCNTQPCPVNCVGSWTAWTNCSKACGGGTSNSTFIVTTPAAYGGTNCSFTNNVVNSTSCNTQPCPVSCVGSWTVPTSCSKTCGNGTQNSTYIITTVAANGGANCSFANNTVNTASCNTQPCPVNCVGSWTAWTNCNQTCGGGSQTSTYLVTTQAAYNGTSCSFANGTVNSTGCNTQPCPVNCVGAWVNTTTCTKPCGNGTLMQTFVITTPAAYNGTNCTTTNGSTRPAACNTQACVPVNCVASWVNTTSCNQSCANGSSGSSGSSGSGSSGSGSGSSGSGSSGTLTQTYVITTPAANGGTSCAAANGTTQTAACNTQACMPANCVASWVNTTSCNRSCGGGTLTQTYVITTPAANGGTSCAAANGTTQIAACNTQACPPINCVANWSNTTSCNQSCGGGTLTQTYVITTPAAYNGTNCTTTNGSTRAAACNTQACVPVNCVASWVNTTSCNQSCANGSSGSSGSSGSGSSGSSGSGSSGTLTQTYVITTPAANGGTSCAAANGTTQTAACNTQACMPVNCVASWVNTTSCNRSCGGGTLTQTYVITTPAANGGTSCAAANGTTQVAACNTQACPPINCVANWSNTTSCNQSCGGGTLTQTYVITTPAAYNGTNCTTTNGSTRAAACNTQACPPVNCVASWVNTTSCNQSCANGSSGSSGGGSGSSGSNGGSSGSGSSGTLTQTYVITTPAANGGTSCAAANGTTQTAACNTQACMPVNCVASWVNTTSCNRSCGGSTLTQTYVITTPAANGGTSCAAANGTTQTAACNTQACPAINCVANWANTTSCNQSCGGGTLTQTYVITTPAANGGTSCAAVNGTTQTVSCNTQACVPVNCVASWVNTTSCNQSCGGGTLAQTYVITTPAANGGTSCAAANGTTQTVICNTHACPPVHCDASWVNTTGCNQPCGGGTLTQTYVITTPAANGGTSCITANGVTQPVACNTQACSPVDCVGSWVNATDCDQPCGGGTLSQTYVITTPAAYNGTDCNTTNGTTLPMACNTETCTPVDCVGSWTNTTDCDQPCGGGTLTQTYVITTPAAYNGTDCNTTNGATLPMACNTEVCTPVDCVGRWTNITDCDQPCGGGTLTQTYVITTPAAYNGTDCNTTNGTTQPVACNTEVCTPVDCVGRWANTTDCDQPCGGGTLTQTYVITTPAAYNGTDCNTTNGTTLPMACNTETCTQVDCVGSWTNTTDCDQLCGGGTLTQTYVITTPAAYNGTDCNTTNGATLPMACNTEVCTPVDCVGRWTNTTDCDQPCGGGKLTQTYVITTPAAYNGTNCNTTNGTTQPVACNTEVCTPVDCVGRWTNTTDCDQPCGGGTLSQTYVITTPAAYNGTDCNTTNGTTLPMACNTEACTPVDCVGSWVNTTDCDQPCGGGTLSQTYVITTPAAYNGTDCNTTNGTTLPMACNTEVCTPVDCVGRWTNTTDCDQPCGGGTLTQTYVISTPAAYNGTDCNTIYIYISYPSAIAFLPSDCNTTNGTTLPMACNTEACTPVDCVGSWVNTTDCDQPCGDGTLSQTYVITTPAAYNGTDCNTTNGTTLPMACNTETCTLVDCVGSWMNTTDCDQPCGGGTLTQTYVITTPAAYNGTDCTTTNGTTLPVAYNTETCMPVDCVGSWTNTTDCDQPCGGGTLTQTYIITTPAAYNGADCNTSNGTTQPMACNIQACTDVDCVGSWVDTTACDKTCGGGTLTQTYVVTTPAAYNGTDCASANGVTQTVDCNTQFCRPIDCFGIWVDTTDCDQPCGGGTLTQTYVVSTQAADNGTDCAITDGTTQPADCNTQACTQIDCVGSWVNTTDCDQPCGGGTLTQAYVITTPAAYNGTHCSTADGTTRLSACNTQACSSLNPIPASPSSGSLSPSPTSPLPSPSPSPAIGQPTPQSSAAAAPSAAISPSPGASPSPSPAAHSPSPSPRPSPSPSPRPSHSPSPHATPSPSPSPSPRPSPSPDPAPSIINATALQQVPYYISPPVLPPLPAMNNSNITIRGGNVTIIGVKVEAGGVSVANSDKTTPASPAPTGTTLPQTNLTLRWAAFNGSLGFYTLGVTITVYGQFVLQRSMNWTWSTQYSAWTTEVSIQGQLVLTRVVETSGQEISSETLNPEVSGLLTLFNSEYPGPGFSGTYDWAGSLPMVPDPFAYWGITSLGSTSNSSRHLMAVPQTTERGHCCPTIPGRLLLETDNGNTPVQGRVSVREANSKAIGNTAGSKGQSSATDDEISVTGPVAPVAASTGGTTSYSSDPFKAFIAALSDPENRKFVILAAVLAPTGLAVCVASIVAAVLCRKKRRKEEELKKQQKLKNEQDAGAEAAAVGGSTATSSAVPARKTARRRTGSVRGKGSALFRSSSDDGDSGGAGGGGRSAIRSSSSTGCDMYDGSHVEVLDPADASHFASLTGYNLRARKQRASLPGHTPTAGAEGDQVLRFDPVDTSLSGSGVETTRSTRGKQKGRFGSLTGSIAGMASSIAGAIGHLRHSQTGQAYKVHDRDSGATSPRSTVELPREGRERGPTLPGSARTNRGSLDLGRQGYLDLNAYPGSQQAAVDWGITGAFKVTPPNSAGKTKLTPPPPSAARMPPAAAAATASRPQQNLAGSVPAQWALPSPGSYGAQSRTTVWATGKAAAWAAELKAASRGSTPPPYAGESEDADDDGYVVTGGSTFLLPSRSRTFGGK